MYGRERHAVLRETEETAVTMIKEADNQQNRVIHEYGSLEYF